MALINIDSAIKDAVKRLKKLSPPEGIEVLSYKRNRGVSLLMLSAETVRLIERGHDEQDITLPLADLSRKLKSLFKVEFPRSRKVRIFYIIGPEAVGTSPARRPWGAR